MRASIAWAAWAFSVGSLLACGGSGDAASEGDGGAPSSTSSTRSGGGGSDGGGGSSSTATGTSSSSATTSSASATSTSATTTTATTSSTGASGSGGGAPDTCSDGVKDGDETGVDCGGSCAPCGAPTGAFLAGRSSLIGDPTASSWDAVDLDGDGKLDAVVKLTSFTTALGNGDGVVAATGAFVANSFPLDIRGHGDFDGDGKGDVLGCYGNNGVVVFRGSAAAPSGILDEAIPAFAFGPTGFLTACATADFNGDGKPDVAVGTASGTVEISLNTGTKLGAGIVYPGLANVKSIVPFDVDGQAGPDLLALDAGAAKLQLFVSHGDGTFAPQPARAVPAGVVQIAPFREASSVSVALLTGAGGLQVASLGGSGVLGALASVSATAYQSVAAGDLVGDGSIELVATRLTGGFVDIYARAGSAGTWQLKQSLRPNWLPQQVRLVDWNGDGKLDISWLNGGSPVTLDVLLNQGNGVFPNPTVVALDAQPFSAGAFGDLDGDGRPDALIAVDSIPNESYVDVYLAQAAGGFTKSTRASVPNRADSLLVGAFSGDAATDVIVLDTFNRLTLMIGDGAGKLTAGAGFYGPPDASGVFVGDADGAGSLDLFVPAPGGVVAYGPSGGFFGGASHVVTPSAWPGARAVVDVDGDGKQDLVVTGLFSGGLAWARSEGGFTFDAPVTIGPAINVYAATPLKLGALPRRWLIVSDDGLHDWKETATGVVDTRVGGPMGSHIVRGDWDGDGIDDVIVAGPVIALHRGNADGTYTYTGTTLLGGGLANAAALADATGDGRKDIVVVNHYGGITTLAATP